MMNDAGLDHNDMIMSSDWSSFLANLVQSHQGRMVAIERNNDSLLQNPPDQGAPLQAIELRSRHKQPHLIITTAAQTYTIEAPNIIWAILSEHGELIAVEILDGQERSTVMRFVDG